VISPMSTANRRAVPSVTAGVAPAIGGTILVDQWTVARAARGTDWSGIGYTVRARRCAGYSSGSGLSMRMSRSDREIACKPGVG